ncbi:hypothetical protein ACLOJK_015994 [Asimina triloba]
MLGRSSHSTTGHNAFRLTIFVAALSTLAIIALNYQSEEHLLHPHNRTRRKISSQPNFKTDGHEQPSSGEVANPDIPDCDAAKGSPIDCRDPEVFQLMMMAAIERFKDIHFSRFGKSVPGSNDTSCDMAWRYRPKQGKADGFYKDYRRFVISRSDNCTYSVVGMGDYHTGLNARKRKNYRKPAVVDAVNDSLPLVESESAFVGDRYLVYGGGGDRCKNMNHYLQSFLCALGEARYLRRTLVMDMSLCLSSMYTSSNQDEEGKDFRFYFDFQHLKESALVLDQTQFWLNWEKWQVKDKLGLYLVEDYRIPPMKLVDVRDSLIMRKFGAVEPDNYWYRVCQGETESIVKRPRNLVRKSKRLMDVVPSIADRMNSDFDSVHVVGGENANKSKQWTGLAIETSTTALLSTLGKKIKDGRNLYVATDEPESSLFDPLKDKYSIHFLHDFSDLWDESSKWYGETKKLNNGIPVEFDGYMRAEVDNELFLRGKMQVEIFVNPTNDCKDGMSTSHPAS